MFLFINVFHRLLPTLIQFCCQCCMHVSRIKNFQLHVAKVYEILFQFKQNPFEISFFDYQIFGDALEFSRGS